jgi:nitroreductase
MSKRTNLKQVLTILAVTGAIVAMTATVVPAQETKSIQLAKPDLGSGIPLMQALSKRYSSREFSPDPLPVGVLSNLLWAGFGINRPDGMRTAPSGMNWQDIDVYVILSDGLYLYDAKASQLKRISSEDLRGLAGTQDYVKTAPVNLIYVSDFAKMENKEVMGAYGKMTGRSPDEAKLLFAGAHTGTIAQNVYLYCASEGLATVVRAFIDTTALAKAMQLRPDQKITLGQSVGYPKKK